MVVLEKIEEKDSVFGKSFDGKGNTEFYSIYVNEIEPKNYAGEIEYEIDKNEILSIHIDNQFRGQGIGKDAVMSLFEYYDVDNIYAWAAKSSIPFWKKISNKCIGDDFFVINKTI